MPGNSRPRLILHTAKNLIGLNLFKKQKTYIGRNTQCLSSLDFNSDWHNFVLCKLSFGMKRQQDSVEE